MTQLIVGGVILPQTSNDKYQCYPEELATTVDHDLRPGESRRSAGRSR